MSFNEKFEDIQHQINVLGLQALKKLQDGDFDGFNMDWDEANRCRLNLQAYLESEEGITEMKYGQNINFGIMMNVLFENFNKKLQESEKKDFKKFKTVINAIKKDNILKEQFDIYNAFTNKALWEDRNPELTKQYVDELCLTCERMNRKETKKHNLKLVEMFKKFNFDENILIDEDELKLYESIENILFGKNNIKEIDKLTESKQVITDYLCEHIVTVSKENVDFDSKVSEITEKYEKELNDDEKRLIETIETCADKEKLFNDYKSKTLDSLSENINTYEGNDREELEMIIEKLNKKEFNEKTILSDVAEMIEINNIITSE